MLSWAALLLLAFAIPAWADKDSLKDGFMGVKWGASAATMSNKTPVPEIGEIPDAAGFSQQNVKIGSATVDEVIFVFYKDRFTQAVMQPEDWDAFLNALNEEFGASDQEVGGVTSWVAQPSDSEFVTIGAVKAENAVTVLHSTYFMEMMQAMAAGAK